MGAGVGSTLDGAALNYVHTNHVGITASAGAGPQVPWACQAGGIGDVHGGAAQLLGVDQGVVVGPLLGAQRAPHLLRGSLSTVQRYADVL